MMALTGDNFCVSARDGYNLILKNFGNYIILQHISDMFTLFGCIFIGLISLLIGYNLILSYYPVIDHYSVLFLIVY